MSYYLKWGEEKLEDFHYNEAKTKASEITKQQLGDEGLNDLGDKTSQFISMNPFESEDLAIASASMNITPKQYNDLWTTTRPQTYNYSVSGDSPVVELSKKFWGEIKDSYNNYKTFNKENQYNLFGEADVEKAAFINAAILTLNSLFEAGSVNLVNTIGLEQKAYQAEWAEEKGLDIDKDFARYVGDKDTEKNEVPLSIKLKSFIAGFKSFSINNDRMMDSLVDNILNKESASYTPYISDRARNYLLSKNLVDDLGNPMLQKTDIQAIEEAFPDVLSEQIKIKTGGIERKLTLNESVDVYIETFNELLSSRSEEGLESWFGRGQYLEEARESREGFKTASIASNFGDLVRYSLTGSLSGEYSPKMAVRTEIQDEADTNLFLLEQAYNFGTITEDDFNKAKEQIDEIEQTQLSDMEFDPKHGFNAWIGFGANLYGMVKTDPFLMASKGVGAGGRAVASEEVLTGVGKQLDEHLRAGGTAAEFFAEGQDDAIRILSDKISELAQADAPLFSELTLRGFSPEVAWRIVDNPRNNPQGYFDIIKDSLTKGYISDIRVNGKMSSNAKDFHLQPKVFSDNFLDNIAETMSGNTTTANYIRGGGTKGKGRIRTATSSIKDVFLGTDVRIPSRPFAYLTDQTRSVDTFIKTGRLFSVPTSVIEELSKKFYVAVQDKNYKLAQSIFYDELILREGAIQLKAAFGLSDVEITEFFSKHLDDVRGFGDEGRTYRPTQSNKYYDEDFVDPFTKAQYADQVPNEAGLVDFTQKTVAMAGQAMDLTINIPDLRATLIHTGIRRRLRNKVIGSSQVDESIKLIREASAKGTKGNFFDPETPLGQITKDAFSDLPDESFLYKKLVMEIPSAMERGMFSFISRVWMPLQLVTRIAFPLKITMDGSLRVSTKGLASIFRDPQEYLKMIMNDPDGLMLRVLEGKGVDIKPLTSLRGPFRVTKPIEGGTLSSKLPLRFRKSLGAITEGNSEFGVPEVRDLYERDPKFTSIFRKDRGDWEDIYKTGEKDVAVFDDKYSSTVQDFKVQDEYIEAYIDYLVTQMAHDPFMPIVAGAMKKGMSDEEIVKAIKSNKYLMDEIDSLNRKILSRQNVDGKAQNIVVIKNDKDFLDFVKHHRMTINNFTGADNGLIEVISSGRVGKIDVRDFEVLRTMNTQSIKRQLTRLINRNIDNLPASVPGLKKIDTKGIMNKYTALTDALFFTVGQAEASLVRIPTFKQAYLHYIDANMAFAQRNALADMLKNHYDPTVPVNLSDDLVRKAKRLLEDKRLDQEEIDSVMSKIVKQSVSKTDDGITVVSYSSDGLYTPRALGGMKNNQLEFNVNIQNAERKAYITDKEIANVRLGDDNTKIGTYYSNLRKEEVVLNGSLLPEQKSTLRRTLIDFFGPDTNKDANAIVDSFEKYLKEVNSTPSVKELRKELKLGNIKYEEVVNIAQRGGLHSFLDEKTGKFIINNPKNSPIVQELTEIDYHTMLDRADVRSDITRNMTYDDLDRRAAEAAFEIHNRLLYNLLERGYVAEAYRLGLPFFEAYREVLGRWYQLGTTNTKATAQVAFAYRKGLEENLIYDDKFGEQYLIIPVGGTALENYVKSGGEGVWTDDIGIEESGIILKRSFPLSALGVAGGGLFPPLGPVVAIPVGLLTAEEPEARRMLERTIFQFGLPFEGGAGDLKSFVGEVLLEETLPATGKNILNSVADKLGFSGLDEDLYSLSTTQATQIASILFPDEVQDSEFLFDKAAIIRDNIYQLKAWDRNVNPLVPRMNVLYRADLEDSTFLEWYGKEGEESGLVWNSFVELSVIHSFWRDIKVEYAKTMGVKEADFQATKDIVRFLGLDKYSLEDSFTSASMQLKGKSISESGKLPMTKPEYDFYLENPELFEAVGGNALYFFEGLGEGEIDYSAYGALKGLGMVTPLTKEEFYYRSATYAASIVERAAKAEKVRKFEEAGLGQQAIKAELAKVDIVLAKLFPLAYGDPVTKAEELSKLPGYQLPEGADYSFNAELITKAANDPRFSEFAITPVIKEYTDYRTEVLKGVQLANKMVTKEDAAYWVATNDSAKAQAVRELLYKKASELIVKDPMFGVVFEEVFYNEVVKFGVEN